MREHIEPPESVDLYRHHNGSLIIRERKGEGDRSKGPPWTTFETNTRVEEKARKVLAKYLTRRKITAVTAENAPIIDRFAERRGAGGKVIPKGANGHDRDYRAEHARRKTNAPAHKAPANTETIQRLVQVIGQSLASAATALRLLHDQVGEPPPTD